MGQITVNTPDGPITVNIEGDTPTEQETQAILQSLTPKREAASLVVLVEDKANINKDSFIIFLS